MELTIYTYGHIDSIYYMLNGMAMIMGSTFADMLIKTMSFVSAFYFGIKIAYSGSSGQARSGLIKIGAMILVVNSLLIPKTTMYVEDHVTKQKDKVDNIPYGFAIPVGFMEQFGNIITASFEQAFTFVGSNSYINYGMVFGSRLIQEARNWRIKTPDFIFNMDNFIRRCVIIDASLGKKYTVNELLESNDVWQLVSSKASPLRRVDIKDGNTRELITCKDAADRVITPEFGNELDRLLKKYTKSEFNLAGSTLFIKRDAISPNSFFKANLKNVFSSHLGANQTAEASLRQFMMMNSMKDYSRVYGYSRAAMTQESNWQIAGDLASVYLPILLSVIKGLVYASFLFMVPLILLGSGGQKYMAYLGVVASLQLWPALNAILNMFIDLYSSSQLNDIAGGVISFASYSQIGSYADKIVAVASGLQMVIPFLAFNIVQGGVGGFIHLASNITGASTSAAASASSEVTSGNKSFDNYSSGNMQIAMNQGFKTDWNKSFRSGSSEYQHSNGAIEKTLPNGQAINIEGAGITDSAGTNKIIINEETTSQLHDSYSKNLEYRKGLEMQKSESQKSLETMLHQYSVSVNKHEAAGNRLSYDRLGSDEMGVREALSHSKNLSSNYDYSDRQSNALQLSMGVGGGIEKSFLKGVGISGNISGKGEFISDNSNTQALSEHNSNSNQIDWNEDQRAIFQAVQNKEFNKSAAISEDLVKNINHTYEKIQSIDKNISHSIAIEDQIQKQISHSKYISSGYNNDITGEVKKELVQRYNISSRDADYIISNQSNLSQSDREKLHSAKNIIVTNYMKDSETTVAAIPNIIESQNNKLAENATKMSDFYKEGKSEIAYYNKKGKSEIIESSKNLGVSKDNVKEEIDSTQSALQLQHQEIHNRAVYSADKVLKSNLKHFEVTQNEINKTDKARIFGKKKGGEND